MTKLNKALAHLTASIANGVEFPDAHYNACAVFKLGESASEDLIRAYDEAESSMAYDFLNIEAQEEHEMSCAFGSEKY